MVRKKVFKKKRLPKNPNKVNQYTLPDPRQSLFLSYYFDPESDTFSNCYQSALKAKYEDEYAKNLTNHMPKWLAERVEEMHHDEMLRKAKRNLNEILDINHIVPAMGPFGPLINKKTKKPYMRLSTSILKIKGDTSEFIAERLDRKRFGKDVKIGIGIQFNMQDDIDKYKT